MMLDNDIAECVIDLHANLSWFGRLDEVRRDVLIDMCFNLGIGRLLGFRNMLDACRRESWLEAANEMMNSKWARQVGNRAQELAEMMETGERA
jgi:lysozyme